MNRRQIVAACLIGIDLSEPSLLSQHFNEKTATQQPHPVINKLQSHLASTSLKELEIAPTPNIYQGQLAQHHISYPHNEKTHQSLKEIHQESTNNFKLDSLPSYSTGIRINFGIIPQTKVNSGYTLNAFKASSTNHRHIVNFPQILLNASYKANSGNWLLQNNKSIAPSILRVQENKKKTKPLLMINDYQPNITTNSLSTISPSVLTPFFQQVQLQQQNSFEASKNYYDKYKDHEDYKYQSQGSTSHNSQPYHPIHLNETYHHIFKSSQENMVTPTHQNYISTQIPSPQPVKATVKNIKHTNFLNHNKLTSLLPLQDAKKISYIIVASQEFQTTPPSTSSYIPFVLDDIANTTDPTTQETFYPYLPPKNQNHIKQPQQFDASQLINISIANLSNKPFLPTPNVEDTKTKTNFVTSNYFTIEDAMTIIPEHQTKFYGSSSILPDITATETILLPIDLNNIVQIANKTGSKPLDNSFSRQKPKRKRPKPFVTDGNKTEYERTTETTLIRTQFNVDSLLVAKINNKNVTGLNKHRKPTKLEKSPATRAAILTTHKQKKTTATTISAFGKNKTGNYVRKTFDDISTRFPQTPNIATTERNIPFQSNNTRGKTKLTTVNKVSKEVNKTIKTNNQSPFTTSSDPLFSQVKEVDLITRDVISNNSKLNRFKPMNKQRPKFSIRDFKNQKMTTKISLADEVQPTVTKLVNNIPIKYPVRTRLRNNIKNILNATMVNQISNSPKNYVFPNNMTTDITEKPDVKRIKIEPLEELSTTNETIRTSYQRGSTQRILSPHIRRKTTYGNLEPKNSSETTSRSAEKVMNSASINKLENGNIINDWSFDVKSNGQLITTESNKHETAIMKIAKDDSYKYKSSTVPSLDYELVVNGKTDLIDSSSNYSKRIAELTTFQSKDQTGNFVNSGIFKRKIPGYFTFPTENPILPLEAFFPHYVNFQTN